MLPWWAGKLVLFHVFLKFVETYIPQAATPRDMKTLLVFTGWIAARWRSGLSLKAQIIERLCQYFHATETGL